MKKYEIGYHNYAEAKRAYQVQKLSNQTYAFDQNTGRQPCGFKAA